MGYNTQVEKAGEQVIDAVKRIQGMGVATVSTISESIGGVLPQLPELPFAGQLPTARELVTSYFNFAQEWVKAQRNYALNLIDALAPVTDKVLPNVYATKSSPRKATARKAA